MQEYDVGGCKFIVYTFKNLLAAMHKEHKFFITIKYCQLECDKVVESKLDSWSMNGCFGVYGRQVT